MGIISDFFVAAREDAVQYEALFMSGQLTHDRFMVAEYKRIVSPAPGMLWAMLRNERWDPEIHALEHISHAEDGSRMLHRLPDDFVRLLADLNDAELDRVGVAWAGIREVASTPAEICPMLRVLRRLSRVSLEDSKGLYLWNSL